MKMLKKLICTIVSLLMICTSCTVLNTTVFAAEDSMPFGFDLGNIDISSYIQSDDVSSIDVPDFDSIQELLDMGLLGDFKIGPMTLAQIYDAQTPSDWSNIKNTGDIPATTFYLVMGNLNLYFKNFFDKYYTDETIYSSRNATWLANKIIDIFFGPNHPAITVTLTSEEIGQPLPFVKAVLRNAKSGITPFVSLVESGWVKQSINYLPLVNALGVNPDDIYKKDKAQEICEETLLAMIEKFLEDPLFYILDVIWAFTGSYHSVMTNIMKPIMVIRINNGDITEKEIEQPHEMLNLVFNNNNPDDTENLQFFEAPYVKMGQSGDRTELFYYVFIYALLTGTYKNNENVLRGYEEDIRNYNYVEISNTDKEYLCGLLEALATFNVTPIVTFTTDTLVNNVTDKTKGIFQSIIDRIKEILVSFIDTLDKLFSRIGNTDDKVVYL